MSDERMREVERRLKLGGSVPDAAKFLLQRIRTGEIPVAQVHVQACMGDELAQFVVGKLDEKAFLKLVKNLPWLQNLGRPNRRDASVTRIASEREWMDISSNDCMPGYSQHVRDQLFALPGVNSQRLQRQFDRVFDAVKRFIAKKIGITRALDPAYRMDAGTLCCAWFAAVIACYLKLSVRPPSDVAETWYWLAEGHLVTLQPPSKDWWKVEACWDPLPPLWVY